MVCDSTESAWDGIGVNDTPHGYRTVIVWLIVKNGLSRSSCFMHGSSWKGINVVV